MPMLIWLHRDMSANTFSVKSVLCDSNKVHTAIQDVEDKWLESLLLRLRVPKPMLKSRNARKMSNAQWRDYLFNNYGLNIYKHLETKKVSVYKYATATDENVKVAEWYMPEVIRVKKKNKKVHCKLKLRYWQIV